MNEHDPVVSTQKSSPVSCPSMRIKAVWIFCIALLTLVLDLGSKVLVIQHLKDQPPVQVIPGLMRFVYAENPGIAFGMFTEHGEWLNYLTPLAFVVLMVILFQIFAKGNMDKWMILIFGLIIGGALGNILDRMYHGFVVDFIDVYYGTFNWYIFNIADSALTVGEVLLIVKLFFGKEPTSSQEPSPSHQAPQTSHE